MMTAEFVLGFDARERWCPSDRLWPPDRRARYLLRPEVERPRSADVMVWPSIFRDRQLDLLELQDLGIGSTGAPAPGMRGWVQDLWNDLSALRASCPAVGERPFEVIAITTDGEWHFDVPPSRPSSPGLEWKPLGYDVVDGWLLSGLSNCGYVDDGEIDRWRRRWAAHVNEQHLFEERAAAAAFAIATSARVPEHAPFYACRVWRID